MTPPAQRNLIYSSESEDDDQACPTRPRRAARGRGRRSTPATVPTTTTSQLPASAIPPTTSAASTGAPAASRGAKTSRGASAGRAGRSTVRGQHCVGASQRGGSLSLASHHTTQATTTTVSLPTPSLSITSSATTTSTTTTTTTLPSTAPNTSPRIFYGRKGSFRIRGKGKAVPAKVTHCPALDPMPAHNPAPSRDPIVPQPHVDSTTSLTPPKFVPIAVAEEDYSDDDDDGEAQHQGWVIDNDSGKVGDSSDDADDPSVSLGGLGGSPSEDEDDDEDEQRSYTLTRDFQWIPVDNFVPQLHKFDPRNSGLTPA